MFLFLIGPTRWLDFNVLSTTGIPAACSLLPVASKAGFSLESSTELLKGSFLLLRTPIQSVWDRAWASAFFIVMHLGATVLHHGKCCGD